MKAIAAVGPGQVRVVDDVPILEPDDYEMLAYTEIDQVMERVRSKTVLKVILAFE